MEAVSLFKFLPSNNYEFMFDLLEENLGVEQTQHVMPPAKPTVDAIQVHTLPDRFRTQTRHGFRIPLSLILLGCAVLLVGAAAAAFLYFRQSLGAPKNEPLSAVLPQASQTTTDAADQKREASSTPESTYAVEQAASSASPQIPVISSPSSSSQYTQYVPGLDIDSDELTDTEERLYGTDPEKPDSDQDGHRDGDELKRFFDPTIAQGARLEGSSLVSRYQNRTYAFTLYYPTSWVADAVNRSDRTTLITAKSGEYFSVEVKDNPKQLSALEWYSTVEKPGGDTQSLETFTTDTLSVAVSPDGLTAFITRKTRPDATQQSTVIVLSYNPNSKKELNFLTTFHMVIRGFSFTDLSFAKP
jgi:hypothetical protein